MSQSQAIRGQFLFVQGSAVGGTQPKASTNPISLTVGGSPCSSMVACAGLSRKTIELRGDIADLGANPVVVEGTVSEGANDKAFWFPVTGILNAPGLFTIIVDPVNGPFFYEPELTWLRVRAHPGEVSPGTFPDSIGATLAAFWEGDRWDMRCKMSRMGVPEGNPDYQAV